MTATEDDLVERPFLSQLALLGWKLTTGNRVDPTPTGRTSFREVFLEHDLRATLRRINPGPDGAPWLDDARLTQAVSALQRIAAPSLLEANQRATALLLHGIEVEGLPHWDGGRAQTIRYIDFDDPSANLFRAVSQLRVDEPGGQANRFIIPDIVLFVNGIPLVVVECKSPNLSAPIEEAIDQLQRYSNSRDWVDAPEGNPALFHTNALLVATSGDDARVATIGASSIHYAQWKDTSPVPMATVAESLGVAQLTAQHKLVAGMLRPAHLLDIVRSFIVFMNARGQTIKVVCRYQQFRAVQLSIQRLLTGKTREHDGRQDRRGGIVWHTQGSGKSLTMVFLVRKMRTMPALRRFKVVVVTDRKDLQTQLAGTAELTGDVVKVGRTIAQVKKLLAERGPGLVFAMIQKYADSDPEEIDAGAPEDGIDERTAEKTSFPVLNEDESVLVLVDEAHRSHTNDLHSNLLTALPNCARIGFTGTPILMGARKRTHEIFGDWIDRYTIRQSEADGATVPILYEGRTAEGAVKDGHDLDTLFEDMWPDWSAEDLERVKNRYATKNDVLEAVELIEAKAKDMLEHYVENILPNGFKAQIVAVSRLATIRYHAALLRAQASLVAEIEALDLATAALDDEDAEALPRRTAFLRRAHRHLDTIRGLEFAPVISAKGNDDPTWKEWTDRAKADARIERFKKPLVHADPAKRDPLAFLIVKSMLLTGFDAPVEQAMYLDRHIKEAELLQAIARVNRTCGEKKEVGIVVDYYGVARHLKEALEHYATEDVDGALQSLADELPKLRDQHHRLKAMFANRGVEIVGTLTRWERDQLAMRFRRWQHPSVDDATKTAMLGDGSPMAAQKAVRVLESVLLAPTPGMNDDPYVRLHQNFVIAVRDLLSASTPGARRDLATDQLALCVEPLCYKVLAFTEPATFTALYGKKKGLDTALTALRKAERSRYTLTLTAKQFESTEGWSERTSYENAVRDVVPARLGVAHAAPAVAPDQWQSSMAVILGLVDENLEDLDHLPPANSKEAMSDAEALELLRDDHLRAQLHVELKNFLSTLDTVLPRPEGKPYVKDARHFTALYERARRRYRGAERPLGKEVGEKVRKLIDDHVISLGLDPKIPPINILDADFAAHIGRQPSSRAKASEMEHAARHHIRQHMEEDPEHYLKLSERLDAILEEFDGRWDELVAALEPCVGEIRAGRQVDDTGLDPVAEAPFFGALKLAVSPTADLNAATKEQLRALTVELVAHMRQEISIVEFWQKTNAVKQLRSYVFTALDDTNLLPYDELDYVADQIMELAKRNHGKLVS